MNDLMLNLDEIKKLFLYQADAPMLFNSGLFFLLFIVFITIYTFIYPKKRTALFLYVISFSLYFYYKASGWYLGILLLSAVLDFSLAKWMHRTESPVKRKAILVLSVVISLGLLAYFKYTNFLILNLNTLFSSNFAFHQIFLPIGISFYTFQSLSYIIDVYWKKLEPDQTFIEYLFFLCFFPHLVAGPIVKAKYFLPQLRQEIVIHKKDIYFGLWLVIGGLLKKGVIADYLAQYNDLVFADPNTYSGFENLMAMYGYTLQIYCDFSGYSDIAMGLAKWMGFDLGKNFNFPYQAQNLTDFWRRWHIALSSWLRDYLYISLGGNRKGKYRTYLNLFFTMFIGGLWHGAAWRFAFWGSMHGLGLAIHKASKPLLDRLPDNRWMRILAWAISFHFVVFLWIFFRANDIKREITTHIWQKGVLVEKIYPYTIDGFHVAWGMVKRVFTSCQMSYIKPFWETRMLWVIILILGYLMHAVPHTTNEKITDYFIRSPYVVKVIAFIIVVQLVLQFRSASVQPFIYFQF